jgi:hypothetical protein
MNKARLEELAFKVMCEKENPTSELRQNHDKAA